LEPLRVLILVSRMSRPAATPPLLAETIGFFFEKKNLNAAQKPR
jgi:hypothetical protein